jgi:hypothetical protein
MPFELVPYPGGDAVIAFLAGAAFFAGARCLADLDALAEADLFVLPFGIAGPDDDLSGAESSHCFITCVQT